MNGIYHVDFSSPNGAGCGTVFLENGILRGGDSIVAYWGTYSIDGNLIKGSAETKLHGRGYSILGAATSLVFQGTFSGDELQCTGTVPGTSMQVRITMKRIADL